MQASLIGSQGTISLTDTPLTIGRAANNLLALTDQQSSSHHAEIRPDAQGFVLIDLNSTNGTFVNEQRLAPQQPRVLMHGDTVRIGATTFTYESWDASDATARANANDIPNPSYTPTVAMPPMSPSMPSYTPPAQPPHADYQYQQPQQDYQPPQSYPAPQQAYPQQPFIQQAYPQQNYPVQGQPGQPQYPQQQWAAVPGQMGGAPVAAPAQPQKKGRTGLVIIIVAVLVLVVGGGIGGYLYVNRSTPEKTLTAYCAALQTSDAQGFFNQLSARAQSKTSVAKISQAMQVFKSTLVQGIKSCTFTNVQENGSTATASVTLTIGNPSSKPSTTTSALVYENGAWKVDMQGQANPGPS